MNRTWIIISSLMLLLPTSALAAEEPVPDRDPSRLRLGLGVEAGLSGGESGRLLATLVERVGVQFDSSFATYLQVRTFIGGTWQGNGELVAGLQVAPMFETSLAQHLLLGVGPSIDLQGLPDCNACRDKSVGIGAEGRLALRIYGPDQGQLDNGKGDRSGIMLHLAGHPTWFDQAVFTMYTFAGVSFEFY